MNPKLSKYQVQEKIKEFFKDIKNNSQKEIKKIKRLAMKYNLPLKEKRKFFCKKCCSPYKNLKIKVKNKIKTVICEKCGKISRWKL